MAPEQTFDIPTKILDVANELFADQGYDATSLSAIADQVGIRKPSLLYHFESKDKLRKAVLARLMDHWNQVLPSILQAATTGDARFQRLVDEVVAFFESDPRRARLLYREILDRPEALREEMREFLAPWLAILAEYIRRGQAEGRVRGGIDAEAYILQVIQMIVGTVAVQDVFGAVLDAPQQTRRQLVEVIRIARAALFVDAFPHGENDG